jgi:hypothetical protein
MGAITLRGALQVGAFLAGLAALWWLVDLIGDQREAKVYARINAAIERTNVDVRAFNALDDKIAAIQDDARRKALDDALKLKGRFTLTDEEAAALRKLQGP